MWDKARRLANLNNDAFTLVELMVVMAMICIVTGSIYGIFISSNRSYYTQDSVVGAQQSVRVGINSMTRDIRAAGFDPQRTADAGIEVATATKLRFTADMNRVNGIEDTDRERITYEYDAGNNRLRRCLYEGTGSESWQTLINNVSALSFSYLDADGNDLGNPVAAADLESIKTVVISMTVEGENALGGTFTRTLNTRVLFMNLGL
ncbi:MAG: prepilin-type N-terminal cleavage/methylation domain-containing protein [Deltaproteobacteria bacterium]|nr:MAG: prepilin-type N-terminal cleavage/methylation domain-containing protein [Deltaproteobacteria bacterium]